MTCTASSPVHSLMPGFYAPGCPESGGPRRRPEALKRP
jgi:hypothetical protein